MREPRSELVRIDSRGEAHPIGAVAGQRMRVREGAFRLLPSPQHVVMMRFTGEDGRRDLGDGAVVRLSGEICRPGAMCEIFGLLAQTGWKGQLSIYDGESERSLFLDQGSVVGAETSSPDERLGAIMYRFGLVDEQQYNELSTRQSSPERIGKVAVELGFVTQEQVFQSLRTQISEIVYAALTLSDGTFFFLDGFDESRLTTRQVVSANALLMDGVTRLDEIKFFREKIPSSDYVPQWNPAQSEPPSEEFLHTYDAVKEDRSITELGRFTGRGEFRTTRDVFALLRSKHLVLTPPRMTGGLTAIVSLANEALRQVHLTVDAAGRGSELRSGLASFASGAGVYDILFRGAGPHEDGTLEADRVSENVKLVARDDPERTLRQMLHEYVGFGLFSAGAVIGPDKEQGLKALVNPAVTRLQPTG